MEEFFYHFCKVDSLCHWGKPHWLGWLIILFGLFVTVRLLGRFLLLTALGVVVSVLGLALKTYVSALQFFESNSEAIWKGLEVVFWTTLALVGLSAISTGLLFLRFHLYN